MVLTREVARASMAQVTAHYRFLTRDQERHLARVVVLVHDLDPALMGWRNHVSD